MKKRQRPAASEQTWPKTLFGLRDPTRDAPVDAIYDDANSAEAVAARAAFARLAALEAAYNPALVDCYCDDGVIIERTIEAGVEKRVREIPLKKYKAMLTRSLLVSQKAQEVSTHTGIRAERIAPGWVIVRSLRSTTHSRAPAPYEATLRRCADGQWRVAKETATIVL